MRTTLDIDPVVLSAARSRASVRKISLGRAVSELALAGLNASPPQSVRQNGFPVMQGDPSHIVTDELVAAHRDDEAGAADAD